MQLYFQDSYISLYYDEQMHLGIARWRGGLRGAELRETFLICLDLIDCFVLTRWLADDRLMGAIEPADMEWCLQEFIPQLAVSSLLRMARLPSYDEENCEMVEIMINKGKDYTVGMVHRNFLDEQEAMDWLMEPL